MQNDMILTIYEGGFFGEIKVDEKVYIGDTTLRKYMPKNMTPTSYKNKIACGCKTCISAMLLQ